MAEDLIISKGSKSEKYEELIPQIRALILYESDSIANMANVVAALKQTFDFFWVGFYILREDQLVLGPFQGPIACTRIKKGRGVCGTAWEKGETIVVPDVDQFPGHIACSSLSKSEVVIPLFDDDEFIGVLDIDSDKVNDFTQEDVFYLEQIVGLLE
ncbi:GAF domain-containing protein [Massilibacteroides sp.]|uniref:GAF domain-containing protein n=1 Tax=Massilibacteroides sp. TaxID=2034766 RepID=UPI002632B2E5|nr:GAF domain-containing protein [Massilibacteroides sp.]MDD4515086.1 GAF domain-containing protein [Massilibacteroides sp.]